MSPEYKYRAKTGAGKTVRGSCHAADRQEALSHLLARGLVALQLREKNGFLLTLPAAERLSSALQRLGLHNCGSRDLMIFCRQFSTMLKAGIPVLPSLRILSARFENKNLRRHLEKTVSRLEDGRTLADSLGGRESPFPSLLVNMVDAGETAGILDDILARLADYYEKQHDLEEKIRSACAYPLFVLGVACAVVLVMLFFVLPQFESIFHSFGLEMPLFSRLLLRSALLARTLWPLLLPAILAVPLILVLALKREKYRLFFDRLRLRIPIYGPIYTRTMASRFALTLGTLLGGGLSLHQSLQLAEKVTGNRVISQEIRELRKALQGGETIAGPMERCAIFPALLVEMVRIGETGGTLEHALSQASAFFERESDYLIRRLSTILEPFLLLLISIFVGTLVYSVLSPMYQIFQNI
ncbi:MAG TPA: type II secretion system F family protein [Firmicutes bacterium]|mgnify:CR=1 FL=1|nr:type II secretion system F family protein [Bacillota bacterium]